VRFDGSLQHNPDETNGSATNMTGFQAGLTLLLSFLASSK